MTEWLILRYRNGICLHVLRRRAETGFRLVFKRLALRDSLFHKHLRKQLLLRDVELLAALCVCVCVCVEVSNEYLLYIFSSQHIGTTN
jgi:hypothetical protein